MKFCSLLYRGNVFDQYITILLYNIQTYFSIVVLRLSLLRQLAPDHYIRIGDTSALNNISILDPSRGHLTNIYTMYLHVNIIKYNHEKKFETSPPTHSKFPNTPLWLLTRTMPTTHTGRTINNVQSSRIGEITEGRDSNPTERPRTK